MEEKDAIVPVTDLRNVKEENVADDTIYIKCEPLQDELQSESSNNYDYQESIKDEVCLVINLIIGAFNLA